ncbi:YolD-like family protein [Bacillaceae bacterium Marseille-Q3522]|nr:YolD-like family protein [Bacillaceae bacterium Marseille-Q3522]
MKWESSRFMLPEHIEMLLDRKEEQKKSPMPEIDEQEFEMISRTISGCMEQKSKLSIVYWKRGFFEKVVGTVHSVDLQLKRLRVDIDEVEVEYIPLAHVVSAEQV